MDLKITKYYSLFRLGNNSKFKGSSSEGKMKKKNMDLFI